MVKIGNKAARAKHNKIIAFCTLLLNLSPKEDKELLLEQTRLFWKEYDYRFLGFIPGYLKTEGGLSVLQNSINTDCGLLRETAKAMLRHSKIMLENIR